MQIAELEHKCAEAAGLADHADQFLSFMLNGEEYAVDILRVQEIKGWDRATLIPNSPAFMRGVINLRGAIVPVIDLRQRFGMPRLEYGPTTVIIVLRVRCEARERIMGVVVDAVSDVYSIPESAFRPMAGGGDPSILNSVQSLATVEEKMIILLDVDRLLNGGELADADTAAT